MSLVITGQPTKHYAVVDVEATCWKDRPTFQRQNSEVIEIGVVLFSNNSCRATEFHRYIHPIKYPDLSDYCKELTGITQEQIDQANTAPPVYQRLIDIVEPSHLAYTMVSWGMYDWRILRKEIELHGLSFPFGSHINLKQAFSKYEGGKPKGLSRALGSMGWSFQGRPHSGMDDARNSARILRYLMQFAPSVLE